MLLDQSLVDLFQFSNSYATLPGIADIVQHGDEEDEGVTDLRAEGEAYVYNGTGAPTFSPRVFSILTHPLSSGPQATSPQFPFQPS